jgi:hypothetical protein
MGLIGHPMDTKMNWKKSKGRSLASAGASTITAACCCGLSTGNYFGTRRTDQPAIALSKIFDRLRPQMFIGRAKRTGCGRAALSSGRLARSVLKITQS